MTESTEPRTLWYRRFCCGTQVASTPFILAMVAAMSILMPIGLRNAVKDAKPTTGSALVAMGYVLVLLALVVGAYLLVSRHKIGGSKLTYDAEGINLHLEGSADKFVRWDDVASYRWIQGEFYWWNTNRVELLDSAGQSLMVVPVPLDPFWRQVVAAKGGFPDPSRPVETEAQTFYTFMHERSRDRESFTLGHDENITKAWVLKMVPVLFQMVVLLILFLPVGMALTSAFKWRDTWISNLFANLDGLPMAVVVPSALLQVFSEGLGNDSRNVLRIDRRIKRWKQSGKPIRLPAGRHHFFDQSVAEKKLQKLKEAFRRRVEYRRRFVPLKITLDVITLILTRDPIVLVFAACTWLFYFYPGSIYVPENARYEHFADILEFDAEGGLSVIRGDKVALKFAPGKGRLTVLDSTKVVFEDGKDRYETCLALWDPVPIPVDPGAGA